MIVNKKQLAEIIGRSEEWLTQMQKDETFPILNKRKGRGGSDYDTSEVIAWMEKRSVSNLIGNQDAIDLEEGKRRKMAAEAGMAELELLKEQGRVVEIERVADEIGEQLSNFRAKMLSIPSKVAGLVYTAKDIKEIKSILDDAIYEALNEVAGINQEDSAGLTEESDLDADEEAFEASASADSQ